VASSVCPRLGQRIVKEAPESDEQRLDYGFLLALGRRPSPVEKDRLHTFLALQRDEYRSDITTASLLVIKEQVFDSSPGGTLAAEDSVDPKQLPELAAWTAVSRVLLNLDDFIG
jgi:hypothetical protein